MRRAASCRSAITALACAALACACSGSPASSRAIVRRGAMHGAPGAERTARSGRRPRAAAQSERQARRSGVHFAPGSAELLAPARRELRDAAREIEAVGPSRRFFVEGYADADEPGDKRALSRRRAEVARRFLIEHGVPPDQLLAIGRGAPRERGRLKRNQRDRGDRRVEIVLDERRPVESRRGHGTTSLSDRDWGRG